ncbi:MAG TPA: hypothetical protein VFR90_17545 [Methylibium sp.]|uniref:hypothetical protein n=1 Tax=Methylibium sp. TaxID=2067992 RepID=UPI002DB997F4|nr:hypothetical protein [Methylibium sp.]HEU4460929.1 hypothetical protein [Methylibium sp.]
MSAPAGHPHKTELGLDELRARTRGLSQRHRTMLLLVNGQRSRREVLALASQAGVGAEFFDELVAMGLVEARAETRTKIAGTATPVADAPGAWADAASTTRVRLQAERPVAPAAAASARVEAPRHEPGADARIERAIAEVLAKSAPSAGPTPLPAAAPAGDLAALPHPHPGPHRPTPPTLDDAVPADETRPAAEATTPRPAQPARASRPGALTADGEPAGVARVKFSGAAQKPPKPPSRRHAAAGARRDEPRLTPAKPPAKPARMKMPAPAGPLDDEHETKLLGEVRSLLIGTLLVDGPVTSSLTALRVRKARTRFDLTALVWEIERTLVRAKRPREAQTRLAKARDLLGLGNTVVDEETSPDFPRTLPPPKTRS